jgi:hypothetical protein
VLTHSTVGVGSTFVVTLPVRYVDNRHAINAA